MAVDHAVAHELHALELWVHAAGEGPVALRRGRWGGCHIIWEELGLCSTIGVVSVVSVAVVRQRVCSFQVISLTLIQLRPSDEGSAPLAEEELLAPGMNPASALPRPSPGEALVLRDIGAYLLQNEVPSASSIASQPPLKLMRGRAYSTRPVCGKAPGAATGSGERAGLREPLGIASHSGTGELYICDTGNHRLLRGKLLGSSGKASVKLLAGGCGKDRKLNTRQGQPGLAGGPGREALFNQPAALCLVGPDHLYVSDTGNHRIVKIDLTSSFVTAVCGGLGAG